MQDLEHIKIIKTIKANHKYNNHPFTAIIYAIETIAPSGEKYAELWRTYNNYGEISLGFGVSLADYLKDSERFEYQAIESAIDEYIENELTY